MIFVTDTTGLWGNQLWAYANAIALAKECNTKVVIIINKQYYESLNTDIINGDKHLRLYPVDSFPAKRIKWITGFLRYRIEKKGWLKKLLKKLPIFFHEHFIAEDEFKKKFSKRAWYFINSWEQRDNKVYFLKYAESIRSLIQPNNHIVEGVYRRMNELRKENHLIIGIHFRRAKDYVTWHGGRFWLENEVFAQSMCIMEKLLPGKKMLFYIFSDKVITTDSFPGYNIFFATEQNPLSDLFAMGQCDYLIGPLSTFSMWGSFWNKTPLHYIEKSVNIVSLEDFDVIAAQDLFTNRGRIFMAENQLSYDENLGETRL